MNVNECFVCTETDPPPWRSPCLCTDRYIHESCQKILIAKSMSMSCPACAAAYTNVVAVTRTRINWYSKPVMMCVLGGMLLLLTGCAINTGVHVGLRKSSPELGSKQTSALVLATAIFAVASGVGWVLWCSFVWLFGRSMLSSYTISETTHSLVRPTQL